MKKYYMHLLDGRPAFFNKDAGYICFASCSQGARGHNILVESLQQIKDEWEIDWSHGEEKSFDYGYVLVYTP